MTVQIYWTAEDPTKKRKTTLRTSDQTGCVCATSPVNQRKKDGAIRGQRTPPPKKSENNGT